LILTVDHKYMSSTKTSAHFLLIGGLLTKLISFIGSILLARYLFPEDYAYIMVAMIFSGLVQMLGNMGFENYYLQKEIVDDTEEEDTLFVTFIMRIGVNTLLFFLQFIGAYVYASIWGESVVTELVKYFSFALLITAITQINLYVLRKKLNYKPEVYANTGRDLMTTLAQVLFAINGFGALSFVFGSLIGNMIRTLVILYYQRYFPIKYNWNQEVAKNVYFFGKHSLLAGIGTYATQQVDKIILTSFFPSAIVGFYYFASSQSRTIFSYLIHPQGSLIISYSAKYKNDKIRLYRILSQIGYLITSLLAPVIVYLVFFAEPIFVLVFGEKWIPAVPLFQIFLLYYFTTEITFPLSGILMAFGLPQIASKLVLYRFFFLSVGLLLGSYLSDNIVVYLLIFTGISFIFTWIKAYISLKQLEKTIFNYVHQIYKGFVLLCIYIVVLIISMYISDNIQVQMSISAVLFVLVSFVMHLSIYKKELLDTVKLIFNNEHKLVRLLERKFAV